MASINSIIATGTNPGSLDSGSVTQDLVAEGVGKVFSGSFTSGDFSSGVYTYTHNLGSSSYLVQIFDSNGVQVTEGVLVDTNLNTFDLKSDYSFNGSWVLLEK